MKITITKFLQQLYGDKRRKGLEKLAYEHPVDVVSNCYLDCLSESSRKTRLFKCSLLHDVLEDCTYDEIQLMNMLDVNLEEMGIIKLLSRNIENEDGSNYIEGILNNSDALIIKLADRIANMKDLITWINSPAYHNDALKIADKYTDENEQILDGIKEIYPELFDETFMYDHPLLFQVDDLMELTEELKELT